MHVPRRAVDMPADDVQKVRVDPKALYYFRYTPLEMIPPRVGAKIHIRQPTILMAVVVPVHPVEIIQITVELVRAGAGDRRPDGLPSVRCVRTEHWHHPEAEPLGFGDQAPKPGLASHPSGDRKSTRLNSSHMSSSYAVFCLKKKK